MLSLKSKLIYALLTIFATSISSTCSHRFCDLQEPFFDWIRQNDGYIHSSLILTMDDDLNDHKKRLSAINTIYTNEILIKLPPKLQFCAIDHCQLIQNLLTEIKLENRSFWWSYFSLVINDDIDIPSIWTADELAYLNGLQPGNWTNHLLWFTNACHGDVSDQLQLQAMLLIITRSQRYRNSICFNPLFDNLQHVHSSQSNTVFQIESATTVTTSTSTNNQTVWKQTANHMIHKYDILTYSYGDEDSGRLFRDYGLIVPSTEPSEWRFVDSLGDILHFGLFPNKENQKEIELRIPSSTNLSHFYSQIHSQIHFLLSNPPPQIPLYEDNLEEEITSSLQQVQKKLSMTNSLKSTNSFSKMKRKRISNANSFRFYYMRALQTASNEIEKLLPPEEV